MYIPELRSELQRPYRPQDPRHGSRRMRVMTEKKKKIPIPGAGFWQDTAMGFITRLRWPSGFNAILVVCRLTKMRHFISCRDTCTAEQLEDLYGRNTLCVHGLPKSITPDRQF